MSKGNKYPQNRPEPSKAEVPVRLGDSGQAVPTVNVLEERVRDLEDLVSALAVRSGSSLPRCRCGAFATRTITMDHPIAGIHSNQCCDDCGHPQTISSDKVATTTAFELPKVRTARRLNGVLQRAFARAEETVAEAAE